jgi:putative acetyltransferase
MTPTIRPFCLQDAEKLAVLWHASWQSTDIQASTEITAADLRQRIDREISAGWEVFVAEYEDVLLGFMALTPANHCLDQLFIAPNAKGLGIGKDLFRHARTAMPKGFWLRAAADNKEARAFYEAVGMMLDRIEPHPRHGHETAIYVIGTPDAE